MTLLLFVFIWPPKNRAPRFACFLGIKINLTIKQAAAFPVGGGRFGLKALP
jgi:hypothetical protein